MNGIESFNFWYNETMQVACIRALFPPCGQSELCSMDASIEHARAATSSTAAAACCSVLALPQLAVELTDAGTAGGSSADACPALLILLAWRAPELLGWATEHMRPVTDRCDVCRPASHQRQVPASSPSAQLWLRMQRRHTSTGCHSHGVELTGCTWQ